MENNGTTEHMEENPFAKEDPFSYIRKNSAF